MLTEDESSLEVISARRCAGIEDNRRRTTPLCSLNEKDVMAEHNFGFRTRALHAGAVPDAVHGSRAVPIYQTTSFVFETQQDAADLFALQKYGNVYSRIGNPTVAAFEERIASLEGGIGAVATASGQAAEFVTLAALASSMAGPSPSWTSRCVGLASIPPSSIRPRSRVSPRPFSPTPRPFTPRSWPTPRVSSLI